MNKPLLFFFIFLLLFFSKNTFSDSINLKCTTDTWFSFKENKYEDILEEEFTITQLGEQKNNRVLLEIYPDYCKVYDVVINNNSIAGECEGELSEDHKLTQKLVIDRFNGIMKHTFIVNDKALSVTTSKCQKAEKMF